MGYRIRIKNVIFFSELLKIFDQVPGQEEGGEGGQVGGGGRHVAGVGGRRDRGVEIERCKHFTRHLNKIVTM